MSETPRITVDPVARPVLRADADRKQADKQMTGDQSRLLKVSARVRWADSVTDLGTVAANAWGGVVIKWDDGRTSSIHHNDMTQIQSAPKT